MKDILARNRGGNRVVVDSCNDQGIPLVQPGSFACTVMIRKENVLTTVELSGASTSRNTFVGRCWGHCGGLIEETNLEGCWL